MVGVGIRLMSFIMEQTILIKNEGETQDAHKNYEQFPLRFDVSHSSRKRTPRSKSNPRENQKKEQWSKKRDNTNGPSLV